MLTVFPRVRASRSGAAGPGPSPSPSPSPCASCTGQSITSTVLDVPNSNSYSRGSVQVGWATGTGVSWTGGSSKSTGIATSSVSGDTSGGTVCEQGVIEVNAYPPTTSLPNPEYRITIVKVYLNGSLLGTTYGNPGTAGAAVVTQTYNFTRTTSDQVHIEWDSQAF